MLYDHPVPLAKMIEGNTRNTILKYAGFLHLRLKRSGKKAALAEQMAGIILRQPLVLLRRLPYHELLKLQKMVHSKDHAIVWNYTPGKIWNCIALLGLTDIATENDTRFEFIYPDLAEALRPVIDEYVDSLDPHSGKVRFESILLGLLNLYGILTFTDMLRLGSALDKKLTPGKLAETIDNSFLLQHSAYLPDVDMNYYVSPLMFEPEHFIEEKNRRHFNEEARFTLEEVLAAADPDLPLPPENERSPDVHRLLSSLLNPEEQIESWISILWILINNDRQFMDYLIELFDGRDMTIDQVNRNISILMDWTNMLPRWILQGHSSRAIYEKYEKPVLRQRPPKLVMGPNAQKAGIHIPQEEFDQIWKENIRKVGRNDPCPCGSGKKYKHCCGK